MFIDALINLWETSGIANMDLRNAAMLLISFLLIYLAIGKKYEPLLLLPIAFGMLLSNLPIADLYHPEIFAGGHVHWDLLGGADPSQAVGILDYLYLGVKLSILPVAKAAENILAGKYDDKPENWFYMVQGTLQDQLARESKSKKGK